MSIHPDLMIELARDRESQLRRNVAHLNPAVPRRLLATTARNRAGLALVGVGLRLVAVPDDGAGRRRARARSRADRRAAPLRLVRGAAPALQPLPVPVPVPVPVGGAPRGTDAVGAGATPAPDCRCAS